MAAIIKDQGWRTPITVSKRSGLIVQGNGRLEAALLLGCEQVPVDYQDYVSEADEETIPRMEIRPFEHHDYLVFMFHDLRDWMLALQLLGVRQVDYSSTRTTNKIGIGRSLHGKRLIELAREATGMAGAGADGPAPGHQEPGPAPVDQQPSVVPDDDARRSQRRA